MVRLAALLTGAAAALAAASTGAASPPPTLPTAVATTTAAAAAAATAPVPYALQVQMDKLATDARLVPSTPCAYTVTNYPWTRAADGGSGPYHVASVVRLRKGPYGLDVRLDYDCAGGGGGGGGAPVTCAYRYRQRNVFCSYVPSAAECRRTPAVEPTASAVRAAVPTYGGFCDGHPPYPPGGA